MKVGSHFGIMHQVINCVLQVLAVLLLAANMLFAMLTKHHVMLLALIEEVFMKLYHKMLLIGFGLHCSSLVSLAAWPSLPFMLE